MQKTVYVLAKSYWSEREREEHDVDDVDGVGNDTNASDDNKRVFNWDNEIAEKDTDNDSNPLFESRTSQEDIQREHMKEGGH